MRRFLFVPFLALVATASAHAAIFTETSDAGDFLSPEAVTGANIIAIKGTIGDTDLIDAFKFYFGGGPLAIKAQAFILDVNNDTQLVPLPIGLIRADPFHPTDPCQPVDPCHSLADGLLDLSAAPLAAGNYIVGVCAPTDPCLPSDPPYTIGFFISPTSEAVGISAPIPEPATLALLGLGLAGLGFSRRRMRS